MEKVTSLLSSVFSGRRSGADEGAPEVAATVTSIFIYPIKSCRGISVPQACVTVTGFRWDRQWLVVNSKKRAYTQRVEPKLALVEIELPADAFTEDWEPTDESYMVIKAPEMEMLKVPLNREGPVISDVSVWEWTGNALDEGPEASDWFSRYLGKPSHLVRFNTLSEIRPVEENYVKGHKIVFSDLYPFLLLSQGSMNEINAHLQEPMSVNRFRPNILVDGCDPFAEDLWTHLKINKLNFLGVKLCSRCKVPTIDQETGVAGNEPTETLVTFRSDHVLQLKERKGRVYVGQNLVCKEPSSLPVKGKVMAVGDPVLVLGKLSSYAEAGV